MADEKKQEKTQEEIKAEEEIRAEVRRIMASESLTTEAQAEELLKLLDSCKNEAPKDEAPKEKRKWSLGIKILIAIIAPILIHMVFVWLGIAPTMPKSLMWVFNGVKSVFSAEKETTFTNPTGVNVIAVLENGMVDLKKKKEELKDEQSTKMGEAIKAVEDAISKLKTNPIEPKKVEEHLSSAVSILASLGAKEAAGNLQKILSDMVGVMQTKKEEFNPNIHIPPYIPPK